MAKINLSYNSGYDIYVEIRDNDGYVYSTSSGAFEVYSNVNKEAGHYDFPMTDQTGDLYVSDDDFPALDADTYTCQAYTYDGVDILTENLYVDYVTVVWDGADISEEVQSPTITLEAYVTLVEANTFFNNRLAVDAWDDATANDKARALNMATMAIDRLNFAGEMTEDDQDHQFPREDDDDYPQAVKDACCLIAGALLDGKDIDGLREEGRIEFQGYGSVKQSLKDVALPHYVAGIPSAEAWDMLRPFLRQSGAIKMQRVS